MFNIIIINFFLYNHETYVLEMELLIQINGYYNIHSTEIKGVLE